MANRFSRVLPFLLVSLSCGPSAQHQPDGAVVKPIDARDDVSDGGVADGPTPDAAQPIDARPRPDARHTTESDGGSCLGGEATCDEPADPGCGGEELCGEDLTGDGLDNNCDGKVDETCRCIPGDVRPCFAGFPGLRGVGACQDGTERCEGSGELGRWGACEGGIVPGAESCDSLDNDCNGCVNDDPSCCIAPPDLHCPGPTDLVDGLPFEPYVIDGTAFYSGPVAHWTWTVTGGPCDQLLLTSSGKVSFTLDGATSSTLVLHPKLSGDYTITMSAVAPDNKVYKCTFIVHIGGPGLRVELCWDKTGSKGADLDLHLHRPNSTTPWFTTDGASNCTNGSCISNDDCYFLNCKAQPNASPPNIESIMWGYPVTTPVDECAGGPEGAKWQALGYCRNPRLDLDNIGDPGMPENINIDNPRAQDAFRVMVHYFHINDPTLFVLLTHPMVNVYCGGRLKSTYGAYPDVLNDFIQGGGFASGRMWRVADITISGVDVDGKLNCDVKALHPPNASAGYYTTINSTAY